MSGFQGYDQWKTASPYDDEPDPIEEAERWLKQNSQERANADQEQDRLWAATVIEMLLKYIDEEI